MFQRVLFEVELEKRHQPTGLITLRADGVTQRAPCFMQIVQINNGPGFYILYLDDDRQEMNDTDHVSIDDAFAMAQSWFSIMREDWQSVSE